MNSFGFGDGRYGKWLWLSGRFLGFRAICTGKGIWALVWAFFVVITKKIELIKSSEMIMMKFLLNFVMLSPFFKSYSVKFQEVVTLE